MIKILPAFALGLLVACGDPAFMDDGYDPDADQALPEGDVDEFGRTQQDGTPAGIALLAFANHASTTLAVLDDGVPLDSRAAKSIIAHRNGKDGVFGTRDDDKFDSTQEIDDCLYVGTVAMEALNAYTLRSGWVPEGGDALGTWDGTAFTVKEAAIVVDFVNTADLHTLDDLVPLDSRVATGIVAQRPFASVLHLSDVAYLGPAAMGAIKAWAVSNHPAPTTCSLVPAIQPRADTDDTNILLGLATTGDWPAWSVKAFTVACPGWADDAAKRETVVEGLWAATFGIEYAAVPATDRPIDLMPAGSYDDQVTAVFDEIDWNVEDGRWVPETGTRGAAIYERRADLEATLHAEDVPGSREIHVKLDAEECSEHATLLARPDNIVIVVHSFPRC